MLATLHLATPPILNFADTNELQLREDLSLKSLCFVASLWCSLGSFERSNTTETRQNTEKETDAPAIR